MVSNCERVVRIKGNIVTLDDGRIFNAAYKPIEVFVGTSVVNVGRDSNYDVKIEVDSVSVLETIYQVSISLI